MSDSKEEPPTAGLLCRCEHHVLLMRENDEWMFPSGVVQPCESSWECAKRQFEYNAGVPGSVHMYDPRTFMYEVRHKRPAIRIHLAVISPCTACIPVSSSDPRYPLLHTVEWKTIDEARVLLSVSRRTVLDQAWPLLEEPKQNDCAGHAFWIRFWFLLFCCSLYFNVYASK